VNTTDVTTQVADVDARVRTQRESIARIQELLKQAGSVAEIAQVEGELTRRQAELESLLARQKALSGMVAESPITVTLVTPAMPDAEPTPEPPGFLLGLKTGWVMFTGLVGVTLMVIGGLLPFALFFGAVGTAIWFVAKRVAARRRASRADPTWPTPPPSAAPRPPTVVEAPSVPGRRLPPDGPDATWRPESRAGGRTRSRTGRNVSAMTHRRVASATPGARPGSVTTGRTAIDTALRRTP
jgi:hypothetical protein